MGLDHAAAVLLCGARASGVDFSETVMLGRQHLFAGLNTLTNILRQVGSSEDALEMLAGHTYAEPFFTQLGAKQIESVDFSDYEQATHVLDMNLPLPDHMKERGSVVFDGGTIEHIFNVPQVFKNCMEMVKVGGHFVSVTMANNFMGHGFYQFSPELMYRVFTPENGFRVEVILLHEVVQGGRWYIPFDPAKIRGRGELTNSRPTYILTIAKKLAAAEVLTTTPQQSDYAAVWEGSSDVIYQPPSTTGVRRWIFSPIKAAGRRLLFRPARYVWRGLVPEENRKKLYLRVVSLPKQVFPAILRRSASNLAMEKLPKNLFRRISEEDVMRGRWA